MYKNLVSDIVSMYSQLKSKTVQLLLILFGGVWQSFPLFSTLISIQNRFFLAVFSLFSDFLDKSSLSSYIYVLVAKILIAPYLKYDQHVMNDDQNETLFVGLSSRDLEKQSLYPFCEELQMTKISITVISRWRRQNNLIKLINHLN